MDAQVLVRLDKISMNGFIGALEASHDKFAIPLTVFDRQPTCMGIGPSPVDPGSAHYMYFPLALEQRTHYHPSVRYLIVLAGSEIRVGTAEHDDVGEDGPNLTVTSLEPGTVALLRIAAYEWHRFSVPDDAGAGVIAFTVHGDDSVSADEATADLMEDVTIFWGD